MAGPQTDLYERDEPNLSGWERNVYDSVSREEPWDLVERFADLRRISPSEDERAAADYLEDRFDDYGIDYRRHDPECYLSVPHGASVAVDGDDPVTFSGSEDDFETERPAVKPFSYSPSGTVSGELVHLDLQQSENVDEILGAADVDLSTYDLEGAVVLVDAMILAKGFLRAVEDAGAAALVTVHPGEEEPHVSTSMPIWGAIPDRGESDRLPGMPTVSVSATVGEELVERAAEGSREATVETDLTTEWASVPLVVAEVPADADTDDFVLVHGHLDSWYYGVTDNATGNATMLEVARVLADHADELARNVRFAFWPAHEGGRYGGSTWYVDHHALDVEENCVAHVNVDSTGVAGATEFNMTMWNREGDALCRGAIDDVCGKSARDSRPPRAGDYSFYNVGVSGVMALSSGIPESVRESRGYHAVGGSGGNSDAWHLTADTLDKADPDVLLRDTRVYAIVVARLAASAVPPLDHREAVAEHRGVVAEYDAAAGEHYDLSPVAEEFEALATDLETFYDDVEAGRVDPETATDAVVELSRLLVPVAFARKGRFVQDPAEGIPPLPGLEPVTELPELSGDEYRFRRRQVRRAANAVRSDLRAARRALP
jgi:hypothetical protein